MKKIFILMLGLVAGTASFAQSTDSTTPATTVTITNDQKLKLIVGKEEATATITLRDAAGHVLYSNTLSLRDGLQQKFNLTQLDEGSYQLAVVVGKETVVKAFSIANQPAQKLIAFGS
ncbi:DUF3244 domain-containing protein [Spirosoma areae]